MKFFMALCAVICFGFAGWVAQNGLVSDIQFILMVQGVIGGMICVGIAGVIHHLEEKSGA